MTGRRELQGHGGTNIGAAVILCTATLLGWIAIAPAPASAAGPGIEKGRLFKVLAPRDDNLMRGKQMRVRLALRNGVKLRSAQLNGRHIETLFSSRGSRQTAILRTSRLGKSLPMGRNFLSFVVRRGKRGKKDYEQVGFTRVHRTPGLIRRFSVKFSRAGGAGVTLVPSTVIARLKVTLNGRDVSKLFRQGTPLKRRVTLGASDGLKHGANRLIVRAHTHHGQFLLLRREFRIGKETTIAGAGPDLVLPAGQSVVLEASGSRKGQQGNGSPKPGALDLQWDLIRRPAGSNATISRDDTGQPVISTDLPGTYQAKLSTSQNGKGTTSGDTMTVIADSQPLPAVNTFASAGGRNGISVGVSRDCEGTAAAAAPCFFANPGSDQDLQVLVLDRRTLEMKSNRSYAADDLSGFAEDMKKFGVDQAGKCPAWDTSKIILLALRSRPGLFDSGNFREGISIMNVRAEDEGTGKAGCAISDLGPTAIPFSMIGIPGTLMGRAWVNRGLAIDGADGEPGAPGSLNGYLKRASDDPALPAATRSFTSATAIGYDTRRPGAGGRSEYVIGNTAVRVVPDELPADAGGLAIFSFDPVNPEATLRREAFIGHAGDATTGLDWTQMLATLKGLAGKKGIGITSNGRIGRFATEPKADSFPGILEELESVYRTNADTFARAVNQDDGKGTYSMISVPPLNGSGGAALQSSSAMIQGVPDQTGTPAESLAVTHGRLTGTIQRANNGRVFPSDGDVTGAGLSKGVLQTIYAPQQDWPLTPEAGAATANCQQVAFAYLATRFDGLFPGGQPELWKNPATAAACQGRDHTGTSGPRRADTLDSNACAAVEPNADGAVGPAVRQASMTLRTAYQSVNTTFSQAQVQGTTRPADAPFTDADLTCAKNQMIDELAARDQVMLYMDVLKRPQQNLQGQTAVDFGQIAENVKTEALADYTKKLKELNAAQTSSFWTNFALGSTFAVGTFGAFFFPEAGAVTTAFQFMAATGASGQAIFSAVDRPQGNPKQATNEYLLLAAQLDQQAIDIEAQMNRVLTAQQNGVAETEGILMSDPHKLAEINAAAKGPAQVTAQGLRAAQDGYRYRVIQMAYQSFWPQLYSAYRFSYRSGCQQVLEVDDTARGRPVTRSKKLCYEPTRPAGDRIGWADGWWWLSYLKPSTPPRSFTQASQVLCSGSFANGRLQTPVKPFGDAELGSPSGLGAGNEYHPLTGVAPKGQAPPHSVYLMARADNPGALADMKTVAPFFRQGDKPDPSAAGFYPPTFWEQNMQRRSERVKCKDSMTVNDGRLDGTLTSTSQGVQWRDNFYSGLLSTDIWPSPPR